MVTIYELRISMEAKCGGKVVARATRLGDATGIAARPLPPTTTTLWGFIYSPRRFPKSIILSGELERNDKTVLLLYRKSQLKSVARNRLRHCF